MTVKKQSKRKPTSKTNDVRNATSQRSAFVALSFFTGAMGLDLGLEKAGIHPVLASEIDDAAIRTIKLNRPDLKLIGDFRDYPSSEIRKLAGLKSRSEIDLIFGGPPCQAFSTAGKRKAFEDDRGNVFLRFIDLILELRPRYAVIENVRGLLSAPLSHRPHLNRGVGFDPLGVEEQEGGALTFILDRLRGAGFGISFNLYNSANFGSPQIRERVVVVCSRDGNRLPYLVPTHSNDPRFGLKKWRTLHDALKDLPETPCDHIGFPEKRLRFYRMLTEGQNWRDLPQEIQQEALGKSFFAGGGKTGFLRRLSWDKPSPTLVTHPAMPATDLAHPKEDRPLSIQEYTRIQEFPKKWKVSGSLIDQYRQIGNAVPTSLGKAIGSLLLAYDSGKAIRVFQGFPYSRYIDTDDKNWERVFRQRQNTLKQVKFAFG